MLQNTPGSQPGKRVPVIPGQPTLRDNRDRVVAPELRAKAPRQAELIAKFMEGWNLKYDLLVASEHRIRARVARCTDEAQMKEDVEKLATVHRERIALEQRMVAFLESQALTITAEEGRIEQFLQDPPAAGTPSTPTYTFGPTDGHEPRPLRVDH